MGRIGVFVERYTISSSDEMEALMRFSQVARRMGHTVDYLFRPDMHKIPQYDAIFIRALTDPLNTSYVAARTAQLHGKRVLDDPDSIYICCDKINMYGHLKAASVPLPETIWLDEAEVTHKRAQELLDTMGPTVVLKAPNSSFSMYVDKVDTPEEFLKVGKRFLRRSDRIVVQRFVKSEFDWRVGVLDGKPLYVCQYVIPKKRWKILTYTAEGKAIYGPVIPVEIEKADPRLLATARAAAAAVGSGLYGIDLKQVGDDYLVIEVNDNPTINAGDEDTKAPHIYEDVIHYLMAGQG
ncbi:ATP-grasp domain-containing protein [bacterium]|nr:ATP-grasp domain-containing protein [bacterium]